ncbi:hypothetical protein GHT06_022172 [Daphnia sinensis]|uniref:Uncharacterized protein n=1 Tax=Daphnia sinensis TaxID=1820382 RepID=A0AAD5PLE7_9CRUS|nr:hypothetical protein GHT06_022172 [Daphnia sinensis]
METNFNTGPFRWRWELDLSEKCTADQGDVASFRRIVRITHSDSCRSIELFPSCHVINPHRFNVRNTCVFEKYKRTEMSRCAVTEKVSDRNPFRQCSLIGVVIPWMMMYPMCVEEIASSSSRSF